MTKISDIAAALEEFAPLERQAAYDNSGLLVGRPNDEVKAAVVCVDVTQRVLDEAQENEIIIAHHPLIFSPLRRLTDATRAEELTAKAIRKNVAVYACHTNLDAAKNGMSHRLAQWLGLENIKILEPATGFGVMGELPQPEATEKFLQRAAQKLDLKSLRFSALHTPKVRRIALCTGAGEELLHEAIAQKADVFLTADVRHHNFLDAAGRITLADIGHFESEKCAVELICEVIRKKMPTFVVRESANERNPVNYLT